MGENKFLLTFECQVVNVVRVWNGGNTAFYNHHSGLI